MVAYLAVQKAGSWAASMADPKAAKTVDSMVAKMADH